MIYLFFRCIHSFCADTKHLQQQCYQLFQNTPDYERYNNKSQHLAFNSSRFEKSQITVAAVGGKP